MKLPLQALATPLFSRLMPHLNPEQLARQSIDELLEASRWAVQDYKAFDPSACSGIALREVLFLVDRAILGRQAKTEFDQYVLPDDGRKFTAIYNVEHLTSNKIDDVCLATICTIQRLYSRQSHSW